MVGRPALAMSVALSCGAACEQVTRLPVGDERVVPPEVFAVFEASCNPNCHAVGMGDVTFDREGTFVGDAMGTVVPGAPDESRVMIEIDAARMPQPPLVLAPEGRWIIRGWIDAGAPLVDADSSPGSSTGGATGSTGEDSIASTAAAETGIPEYDEFLPVLEIITARCGGAGCHRNGGQTRPTLEDAVAYDNLVGVTSLVGDPLLYVDPGDADASWLFVRVTAAMDTTIMPPAPDDPLDPADIETIRAWIDAGAGL